jgi:osmotically-inducible protein OsmY
VPPIAATQVQSELQTLVSQSTLALKHPENVRVEVNGDTVILRGRVADEEERRLIVGMIRLEPGVHQVIDQLTVP